MSLHDDTNKLSNKNQLKSSQKDGRKVTIHIVSDSSSQSNLFIRNKIQLLNSLRQTKMAASQNHNKISENHNIHTKNVETHMDNTSASQHAEKVIRRLREAKLVEKRKILEYQPTEKAESLQAKIPENQKIKISENHNINKKKVETHMDNISASQHADKVIRRLREAKLVEKRKLLEYQPTKKGKSLQANIPENQTIKISENQTTKNTENRKNMNENQNTKVSKNPCSKSILDQKKLDRAKAKRLKEIQFKELQFKEIRFKEILLKEKGYCPNKRKKKNALCSKNDYKIIGTVNFINKRKRTKPVKEVSIPMSIPQSEQPPEPELTKLTLSELVRETDERGLDEEDFMEILTCPSPVWWESDEEEDFSFKLHDIGDQNALIRELDQKARMDDNRIKLVEENTNKTGSNTSVTNKLGNKRMKLENIINGIITKSLRPVDKNKETDEFKNNEIKTNNDSNERKSKQQMNSKSLTPVNKKSKELDEYENNEIENNDCYKLNSKQQMKSNKECSKVNNDEIEVLDELNNDSDNNEKVSMSGLSDFGLSDELINTLENIDIPVKKTNEVKFQSETEKVVENDVDPINSKEPVKRSKRKVNNKVSAVNNYEFIRKRTRKPNKKYAFDWSPEKKKSKSERPKKRNAKNANDMNEFRTLKINNGKPKQYTQKIKIPLLDLPLPKNPFKSKPRVYASPKSMMIPNSETTNEPDSIPDTNIKFLDEYKEKTNEEVNVNKYEKGKGGELVTVYQIVTNNAESFDDIEAQIKVNLVNKSLQTETKSNSHINESYKTRKRVKKNDKVE